MRAWPNSLPIYIYIYIFIYVLGGMGWWRACCVRYFGLVHKLGSWLARVCVYESSKVTGASESERSRVERRDVGDGRDVCVYVWIDGTEGKAEGGGLLFTRWLFLSPREYFFTSPPVTVKSIRPWRHPFMLPTPFLPRPSV